MIEILEIVGELPPGANVGRRQSQWAALAEQIPHDGKWARITPKPVPKRAIQSALGIEIAQRGPEMYVRRIVDAPLPKLEVVKVPSAITVTAAPLVQWSTLDPKQRMATFVRVWNSSGGSVAKVVESLGVSEATVYAYRKQARENGLV